MLELSPKCIHNEIVYILITTFNLIHYTVSYIRDEIAIDIYDIILCSDCIIVFQEALDWAMKKELWGHALYLASKMEAKTHASVMTRYGLYQRLCLKTQHFLIIQFWHW